MLALLLLTATAASAANIHEVRLQTNRYADTTAAIAGSLEADLARTIVETCGATEKLVPIHRHVLTLSNISGRAGPLHARVTDEASGGHVTIMDYPRGVLEAAFECPGK